MSGEAHRLGDKVTVRLVEAVPVAGALRFELLSAGRIDPALRRRGARTGRGSGEGRTPHGRRRGRA